MVYNPGGARTYSAGGAHCYPYNNITTSPQLVVNKSAQRVRIIFHNPGAQDIFVSPDTVQGTGAAPIPAGVGGDVALVPALNALGGCLTVYANGGTLVIDGPQAGLGWNAFARAGATNPLTVMNSNAGT